jgi:type I restriction enzyme M protein
VPAGQGNLGTFPLQALAAQGVPGWVAPQLLAALLYLRWVDFDEAEREVMAAFEGRSYQPVLPAAMHWRRWQGLPADERWAYLSERLLPALAQLAGQRADRLADPVLAHLGVFAEPVQQLADLPPDALHELVRWVAALPFETPRDRLRALAAFDDVCAKTRAKGAEQARTAPEIARLMAAVAQPGTGETVYDPCCGEAETLLATNRMAPRQRNLRAHGPADRGHDDGPAFADLRVLGVELNPEAFRIGLVRLLLAGVPSPRLLPGNALERPPLVDGIPGGVDLVLLDPPMGARAASTGMQPFAVPSKDLAVLMIQHALQQLGADGRAVVLVPNGLLFNKIHRAFRQWLLERHRVQAIAALPSGALLPKTGIAASILLIAAGGPTETLRVVDADGFFEQASDGKPRPLLAKGAEAMVAAIQAPRAEGPAWDVATSEISAADWDLTPRRRRQTELDRSIPELEKLGEVHPLGELVDIALGVQIPTKRRLRDPGAVDDAIELLGVKSIGRGGQKAVDWVARPELSENELRKRLRGGDVLLSRAGTIGKSAVVGAERVGALPGANLYVLRARSDSVDPHYLQAFLSSAVTKAWMMEQAQGAVIRSLSAANLRRLPVPVPAIQIQSRVADSFRKHGTDAYEYLGRALSVDADNPVTLALRGWLDHTLADLEGSHPPEDWRKALADLEHWAGELAPVRRCRQCSALFVREDLFQADLFNSGGPEPPPALGEQTCLRCLGVEAEDDDGLAEAGPLTDWSARLNDALFKLRGISAVPAETQLYLLQDAAMTLGSATGLIPGHMPDEERARFLSNMLGQRLDNAKRRMLDDISVAFTMGLTSADGIGAVEASLTATNRGALPLRRMQIRSDPAFGNAVIDFLRPSVGSRFVLRGEYAPGDETIDVLLHWFALDLAGEERSGMQAVVIPLPTGQPVNEDAADFGASPYVCANPVDPSRDDVFFGREQELEQIRRQVTKSANVVLLEGNRRAGKSSILKHLEGPEPIPGWLGVYSSLQGAQGSDAGTGVPTADVFRTLAADLAKAVHRLGLETPLPDGKFLSPERKALGIARACRTGISVAGAFNDFDEYLAVLLEVLAERGLGALLLLDEFDKLQEGIDNGMTSPQVPENIRYLVQSHARFSAVLTGSRRLKRLREEYWSGHPLRGFGPACGCGQAFGDGARCRPFALQRRGRHAGHPSLCIAPVPAAEPLQPCVRSLRPRTAPIGHRGYGGSCGG